MSYSNKATAKSSFGLTCSCFSRFRKARKRESFANFPRAVFLFFVFSPKSKELLPLRGLPYLKGRVCINPAEFPPSPHFALDRRTGNNSKKRKNLLLGDFMVSGSVQSDSITGGNIINLFHTGMLLHTRGRDTLCRNTKENLQHGRPPPSSTSFSFFLLFFFATLPFRVYRYTYVTGCHRFHIPVV